MHERVAGDFAMSHVYLFNHIPRTGGTTLRTAFRHWFEIKEDYTENWGEAQHKKWLQNPIDLDKLPTGTLVTGHYAEPGGYLSERYPQVYENPRYRLISWVRDPLALAVSLYEHSIRWGRLGRPRDINEFVLEPYNTIAACLELTEENFESRIDQYFFIGAQDYMQESMDLLARDVDKPIIGIQHFTLNRSDAASRMQDLTDDTIEQFRKRNAFDYEIVDLCRQRLVERLPTWRDFRLLTAIRGDAGLGPIEGPYPDWGMHQKIRFQHRARATLRLYAARPASQPLELTVRTGLTQKNLRIFFNGQPVGDEYLETPNVWLKRVTQPLDIIEGVNTLELVTDSYPDDPEERKRVGSILYEEFRFLEGEEAAAAPAVSAAQKSAAPKASPTGTQQASSAATQGGDLKARQAVQRWQVQRLVSEPLPPPALAAEKEAGERVQGRTMPAGLSDVIVTPNEVNNQHGTGALIKAMFGQAPHLLAIRSRDHYEGQQDFGTSSLRLSYPTQARQSSYAAVVEIARSTSLRRAFCIPYITDEVYTSLALTNTLGIPLGFQVMDDSNLAESRIPDRLMRELIAHSQICFAISPEMRDAYQKKFGVHFWMLPPVLRADLVKHELSDPPSFDRPESEQARGVMVGNVWSKRWADNLRYMLRESGVRVDWYGPRRWHMDDSIENFTADGLIPQGSVPEVELAKNLQRYAYSIAPTGTLDHEDDNHAVSRYSMPSRIIFIAAASHTPIIVVGSPATPAATFVKRFGIGVQADYTPESLRKAVEYITQPDVQREMRRRAAEIAPSFSAEGLDRWIWKSIDTGAPADSRFEDLMPRHESSLTPWLELPPPSGVHPEFIDVYNVLKRLDSLGYRPDFVVDVGASSGIWSSHAGRVWPSSRYLLIDPVSSRFATAARENHVRFIDDDKVEWIETVASNRSGPQRVMVSNDLYGTSLLHPADERDYEEIEVPGVTLDELAKDRKIEGRGLLKIDVQCAEHLVLEGAKEFLEQVDVLSLETSLLRFHPDAKTHAEMVAMADELGFRVFDECGGWRSPVNGMLQQADLVLVRKGLLTLPPGATE